MSREDDGNLHRSRGGRKVRRAELEFHPLSLRGKRREVQLGVDGGKHVRGCDILQTDPVVRAGIHLPARSAGRGGEEIRVFSVARLMRRRPATEDNHCPATYGAGDVHEEAFTPDKQTRRRESRGDLTATEAFAQIYGAFQQGIGTCPDLGDGQGPV